jgi:hypothetical protein
VWRTFKVWLVLAKSGLSDAEITEMRDAMIAAALKG